MPGLRSDFGGSRPLGIGTVVEAAVGTLYTIAVDAGHTSLGFIRWGAMLGAVIVNLQPLVLGRGDRITRDLRVVELSLKGIVRGVPSARC
jgi:hypothetical protein